MDTKRLMRVVLGCQFSASFSEDVGCQRWLKRHRRWGMNGCRDGGMCRGMGGEGRSMVYSGRLNFIFWSYRAFFWIL